MLTVTFEPNGGVGATMTQAFISGQSVTLRSNTFTRSGYTFSGWSTNQNGSGTTYTDGQTVTLTADTTLYAQWRSNSSGYNPGSYTPSSGGNTPSTPSSPTSETHTSETATAADGAAVTTQLDTSTTTTKNSDGSVTVTDKATETVKTENTDGTTVEVKTDKTNAVTTDSKNNADGSVTDTTKISNTETVTQTATDAGGGKTITETKTEQDHNTAVTTKDNADGSKTEKTETTETVKVTEQVKTESGKVLSESVTETTTETKTDMTTARDGTATGTSTTTTTVKDDNWYNEYVTFVTAREIFNGTGNGNFAPNETMTRAMLAQVLYNFARGAKAGNGTVFSDVKAGDWFNAAIGWAYENGIVNGYGGSFGAQNNITRQDMATILYRYAKAAGYDVSKTASLNKFSDAGSVADYAVDAMRWAVGMGLINGTMDAQGNITLDPAGNATRSQVAAIMTRFVRNAR